MYLAISRKLRRDRHPDHHRLVVAAVAAVAANATMFSAVERRCLFATV
jgi:hypothetical protein